MNDNDKRPHGWLPKPVVIKIGRPQRKYQIGSLSCLKDDDPIFNSFEEACDAAVEASIDDSVWGVWTAQDQGNELLALVYGQEVFEK